MILIVNIKRRANYEYTCHILFLPTAVAKLQRKCPPFLNANGTAKVEQRHAGQLFAAKAESISLKYPIASLINHDYVSQDNWLAEPLITVPVLLDLWEK